MSVSDGLGFGLYLVTGSTGIISKSYQNWVGFVLERQAVIG